MTKPASGDHRWLATTVLTVMGAAFALVTHLVIGDSWAEFGATAIYSVAWALPTFGILYLVSKRFEHWEWRRPDHDLISKFEEGLK